MLPFPNYQIVRRQLSLRADNHNGIMNDTATNTGQPLSSHLTLPGHRTHTHPITLRSPSGSDYIPFSSHGLTQAVEMPRHPQTSDPFPMDSHANHAEGRSLAGSEGKGKKRGVAKRSVYSESTSGPIFHSATSNEDSVSQPPSRSFICSLEDQCGLNVRSSMIQNQPSRPPALSTAGVAPTSLMPSPSPLDHQPHSSAHSHVGLIPYLDDHRPPSPALSDVSVQSDHSDTPDFAHVLLDHDVPSPAWPRRKRYKVTNTLRREICLYQQSHPNQKYEEIAERFGVERATVVKILQEKQTWLNTEKNASEFPLHRPLEDPEVEEESEDVPNQVPGQEEAEESLHILAQYLDSNAHTLEPIGYIPEHRLNLRDIYQTLFYKAPQPRPSLKGETVFLDRVGDIITGSPGIGGPLRDLADNLELEPRGRIPERKRKQSEDIERSNNKRNRISTHVPDQQSPSFDSLADTPNLAYSGRPFLPPIRELLRGAAMQPWTTIHIPVTGANRSVNLVATTVTKSESRLNFLVATMLQIARDKELQKGFAKRLSERSKASESATVIDCLNFILHEDAIPCTSDRTQALRLLYKLAESSQMYPKRLLLRGIDIEKIPFEGGGFADVYKGRYQDHEVCIKVIRVFGKDEQSQLLRTYVREIILWSHLHHKNILPFYGVYSLDESSERICLVSPLMQNGNLKMFLKQNPDISRLPLIQGIVDGLCYLHKSNIIHGDLKAQNILLSENHQPLIADFGLSYIALTATAGSTQFSSPGTTNWMAPELVISQNAKPTKMTDIWSFGCLCYEIYTGKYPFYQYSVPGMVVVALVRGEKPLRPSAADIDPCCQFNDWVWNLMLGCWKDSPADRHTCGEILTALSTQEYEEFPRDNHYWEEQKHLFWKAMREQSKGDEADFKLEDTENILINFLKTSAK
ncbi:hypothetical protein NP233_g8719 [Leucocoprinus birnbaumii]|uniref:Protein kinase domain-containing protein n=1 Tax=Leucocoprinus birnbaumii TaxID=56174 RepID=A0AAD5VLS7_9AGAR|nr:hypothetical protein NP233_g8719 [Leucocoprinus birnbaumii]